MEDDLFRRLADLKRRQMELRRKSGGQDLADQEREQLPLIQQQMDETWDAIRRERVARASLRDPRVRATADQRR